MKISDQFIVSSIAGENVILPIDNESVDYNSVFMLNDTGMFIVSCLPCEYEDIVKRLTDTYEISESDARMHLDAFLTEVKKYGIIE